MSSWTRYTISLVMLVTLSGVPAVAAVCEMLCPAAGAVGSEGADHDVHTSTRSTHATGQHEMAPDAASPQPSLDAIPVDLACCAHSVAAPPASQTKLRSERGPVLTDSFAVLVETASAAFRSRGEEPGHRPPISPPSPTRASLVLRI